MQFLWSFIDELVGKGIGALDLAEMLFYRSLSLFPLAFPIGILLASVMVFGGLSERYELSSLKSAGVSLLRVMAPAIAFATAVALFSVFCSNTLIPLSNLKFQSRLYDMRNQKPALSLVEGIFNDDFKGYSIHIGKKYSDNRRIENVVIYDQTTTTRRQFNVVTADRGEMYVSRDKRDFVMRLFDGYHYQEVDPDKQRSGYPFTRTRFSEWTKRFSLSEFDLNYTDEELFKTHHTMKSVDQLIYVIDTIDLQYDKMLERNLYDFRRVARHKPEEVRDRAGIRQVESVQDEKTGDTVVIRDPVSLAKASSGGPVKDRTLLKTKISPKTSLTELERLLDSLDQSVPWDSVYAMMPAVDREQYTKQGLAVARSLQQNTRRLQASLKAMRINRAKHVYELHSKFAFAAICIIFLFIGAPMGAIVRKGGFGYPLLVSVIFFTIFILLTLMFKKLSEAESVNPVLAAWMPCTVMLPMSAMLTQKALKDARMINPERWIKPFIDFADWLQRRKKLREA
jgi:lipopolysaccharide export system permease protein